MIRAIIGISLTIGLLWIIQPTQSDIQSCKDTTGWSMDKCKLELGK